MTRPNFFLMGAPKCGTTALYAYLREHPGVYFPQLKEPRFFAEDFGTFREIVNLEEYESLYRHVPAGVTVVGDGSPWYLCSEVAPARIRDYSPDARVVVILRNPLEMLPSLHNQFLFSFKETEKNFAVAWSLQNERARGRSLPPSTPAPALLQYGTIASFGRQLRRLHEIFPQDQVKVVLFEDFAQDTLGTYRDLLDFLGLEPDGRQDFPVVNERTAHRSRAFGWVFNSPASPVNRAIYALRDLTGIRSSGFLAPLLKGNRIPGTKPVMDPELRELLADYFRDDVADLGSILERDLAKWLT